MGNDTYQDRPGIPAPRACAPPGVTGTATASPASTSSLDSRWRLSPSGTLYTEWATRRFSRRGFAGSPGLASRSRGSGVGLPLTVSRAVAPMTDDGGLKTAESAAALARQRGAIAPAGAIWPEEILIY